MQTIKVKVSTKGNVTAFKVDNKTIGTIKPGYNNPGIGMWMWCRDGNVPGQYGFVGSYAAAVEALGDAITAHLEAVGFTVQFNA